MDKEALFARAAELGLSPEKRWSEDRLRKAIEGAKADAEPPMPDINPSPSNENAPAVDIVADTRQDDAPVPALAEYIAQVEGKHIARDVFAVDVTHPDAEPHVRPCTYGGIRVAKGPLSVRYSDGSTE